MESNIRNIITREQKCLKMNDKWNYIENIERTDIIKYFEYIWTNTWSEIDILIISVINLEKQYTNSNFWGNLLW